jgi:hypothetical protein
MTTDIRITSGASAVALSLFLVLSADSAAWAQPSGKGAQFFSPRPKPPVANSDASLKAWAKCDCPMMRGDAAMRGQCMGMRGDNDDASKPAQPG